MTVKPWLVYKNMYAAMMADDHTDINLFERQIDHSNKIEWALDYVTQQGDYEYFPGKKIIVSLIWAYLARSIYGVDLYDALNDPDLIDTDSDMILYDEDPKTYDILISTLGDGLEWIGNGWGPHSAFYFWSECTEDGYVTLSDHYVNNTLDQFKPENYIESISHLWR